MYILILHYLSYIYYDVNKFRDLKECDGTHSEQNTRRVPTLRNEHGIDEEVP